MLHNEKILITGGTGRIAFPIARALPLCPDERAQRTRAMASAA